MTFSIRDQMDRLRRQVEMHSIIYYKFDNAVITDAEFDALCKALVKMQEDNPKEAKKGYKARLFKDFTGDTGMHLTNDTERYNTATWLIKRHGRES